MEADANYHHPTIPIRMYVFLIHISLFLHFIAIDCLTLVKEILKFKDFYVSLRINVFFNIPWSYRSFSNIHAFVQNVLLFSYQRFLYTKMIESKS